MIADTHSITLTAPGALAAVRALVSLSLSLLPVVTFQAGLEAAAEAVDLEPVREEPLLTPRAPDDLLVITIFRHCLLVSVYVRFPVPLTRSFPSVLAPRPLGQPCAGAPVSGRFSLTRSIGGAGALGGGALLSISAPERVGLGLVARCWRVARLSQKLLAGESEFAAR